MAKEREITRKIIYKYLNDKKPFTYNGLKDKIVENGGILRVFAGVPYKEYIEELENNGRIKFDASTNQYIPQ